MIDQMATLNEQVAQLRNRWTNILAANPDYLEKLKTHHRLIPAGIALPIEEALNSAHCQLIALERSADLKLATEEQAQGIARAAAARTHELMYARRSE
jgi:hypothetical protein